MANRDLQIGDRVTLSPNHNYRVTKTMPAEYNPVGTWGTVVPYSYGNWQAGHWVEVKWDNGLANHYPIDDDFLIKHGIDGDELHRAKADEFARNLYSKTDSAAIGKFVDLSSRQAEVMQDVIRRLDESNTNLASVTLQRDGLFSAINKIAAVGSNGASFQKQMNEVENIVFVARRMFDKPLLSTNKQGENNG